MKPSVHSLSHLSLSMLLWTMIVFCFPTLPTQAQTPLPIPFSEDFETGQWNVNFATSNNLISRVEVTQNYGPIGQYHLLTHSAINGLSVTHHMDIHLNMTGASRDIFFRFFAKNLNQNVRPDVMLWFSDDGGNKFTKLISPVQPSRFVTIYNWQHNWKIYTVNMTDLIRPYGLTSSTHCVIRLVTTTQHRAPSGGIAFDNISVYEERVIVTGELPERTLHYYLSEIEFIDIIECGLIDCPPPFFWDERILNKDFWSIHPGENGMAFLEAGEKGYHLRLSSLPNENGYAASAAALRFDASPWASPDPDGDPAHFLKFSWRNDAKSLSPYDAVYISDNGGDTYAKAFDFSENVQSVGEWQEITLNLSELVSKHGMKFSDRFVVVFQHYTHAREGSPGYAIDNMIVGSTDPDTDPVHPKSLVYPNPFRSETNIQFELAQEGNVRLQILDNQGKIINTITEKNFPAGSHTLQWNGKDHGNQAVLPGMYYYLLETAQGKETRRILLEN